jgi:hypothetical protein
MAMIWQKLIAPTASGGYSCNLTIGGSDPYGYSVSLAGTFGSIDAEPVPGETLEVMAWGSFINIKLIYFAGDIVTLLNPFDVYFNGVNYGGAGSWAVDGSYTGYELSSAPPETSGTYLLELK